MKMADQDSAVSDLLPPTLASNQSDTEYYYYYELATPRPTVNMWSETLLDQIQGYMHLYIPPVLFCTGLVGNIICMVVLRRKSMMQSSTVFYLNVLVVSNLVALTFGLAADWIASVSSLVPVQNISDSSCRIWYFLLHMCLNFPTWLVVALCIDRVICVCKVNTSANKCTPFRAKLICIFIFIGLLCVSVHSLWSYALYDKGRTSCQHGIKNHYISIVIWPWIQAALWSYIPLLLLLVFSPVLLIGTIKNGHLVRVLPDLNKTVLIISVSYFVLATPAAVTNLVEYFIPMPYKQRNSVRAMCLLARAVSQIAFFTNYCLTFIWLCISSHSFRTGMIKTFKSSCFSPSGLQRVPQQELNGGQSNKTEIEEVDVGTQL